MDAFATLPWSTVRSRPVPCDILVRRHGLSSPLDASAAGSFWEKLDLRRQGKMPHLAKHAKLVANLAIRMRARAAGHDSAHAALEMARRIVALLAVTAASFAAILVWLVQIHA